MQGTPAPAVDSFVIGRDLGRLVELRILLEQRHRRLVPRLMPQAIQLRNQPDAALATVGGQFPGIVAAQSRSVAQLGMRPELEAVIDLEHDDVDAQRLESLVDSLLESRNTRFAWRHQVHAPPKRGFGSRSSAITSHCIRSGDCQNQKRRDKEQEPSHVRSLPERAMVLPKRRWHRSVQGTRGVPGLSE